MATDDEIRAIVEQALAAGDGLLRLEPAWVARDSVPSGQRLGLPEAAYEVGERGWISERWLASTTRAENRVGPADEGLSYLALPGAARVSLRQAVEAAGAAILGRAYARRRRGLGRLAKLLDYADRIPFHFHQAEPDAARVGRTPKEEAYFFPEGVDLGPRPETFFGVHPSIVEQQAYDLLLPHLVEWQDDLILRHSRAYRQVPGEGFHVPAGVPHAPGTALTVELQQDSDVFAVLQARALGELIPKELLFKDVPPQERERYAERAVLRQINWQVSGDPYFYENYHTTPQPIQETQQPAGEEAWVFYNTPLFSGKRLVVRPGGRFVSRERGVYSLLVWRGRGVYGGHPVEAGDFSRDELLVAHRRAVRPLVIENSGREPLVVFKFFGPEINPDAPRIPRYPPGRQR